MYNINNKIYKLKNNFTLGEWEIAKKVDEIFVGINGDEQIKKFDKDTIVELLKLVLYKDNEPITEEEIINMNIDDVNIIISDFFLSYIKLKLNIAKHWQSLTETLKN